MDWYRHRLAHARWTWNETHRWRQGKDKKDRPSGRNEKRRARQMELRDRERR